jgi:hypothetical protein
MTPMAIIDGDCLEPTDQLGSLDRWIEGLSGARLSRPEAIRRLVEMGVTASSNGQLSHEACARVFCGNRGRRPADRCDRVRRRAAEANGQSYPRPARVPRRAPGPEKAGRPRAKGEAIRRFMGEAEREDGGTARRAPPATTRVGGPLTARYGAPSFRIR